MLQIHCTHDLRQTRALETSTVEQVSHTFSVVSTLPVADLVPSVELHHGSYAFVLRRSGIQFYTRRVELAISVLQVMRFVPDSGTAKVCQSVGNNMVSYVHGGLHGSYGLKKRVSWKWSVEVKLLMILWCERVWILDCVNL